MARFEGRRTTHCAVETVLPRLFSQVEIPSAVFLELQQPNTPALVREWGRSLPAWAVVQTPKALNLSLDVDDGSLCDKCLIFRKWPTKLTCC